MVYAVVGWQMFAMCCATCGNTLLYSISSLYHCCMYLDHATLIGAFMCTQTQQHIGVWWGVSCWNMRHTAILEPLVPLRSRPTQTWLL